MATANQQANENYNVNLGLTPLQQNEITKLKLEGNIVLGDFIFNTIDDYGVTWVITDIDGWWKHPEVEMPDIDRGWGDGSYDVQGKYRARSISLNGVFLVTDPSKVEAARDRLIEATNLVYKGAWLKTGNSPIRASWVRLSGGVDINTVNPRGRTEFSIPLRAPDPVKYAWNDADPDGYEFVEIAGKNVTTEATGIGTITNIGNYGTSCIIEVSGPVTSPATIYNRTTNQLMFITQSLKGSVQNSIVNKQLSYNVATGKDIATLTSREKHNLAVGDNLYISGVGVGFDGDKVIATVPTDTTFTFETSAASTFIITHKTLTGTTARIETSEAHGLTVGTEITVNGVDALFDGTYDITAVPDTKTIEYTLVRTAAKTITFTSLSSNIATLTTSDAHKFIVGESVVVSGVNVTYDGTYVITATPSADQFSYASTRTNPRNIIKKQVLSNTVRLTLDTISHGLVFNETIGVTGIDASVDGSYILTSIGPDYFDVSIERATQKNISIVSISSNVATISTGVSHSFLVGEKIKVSGSSAITAGTYTITTIPSPSTFTFNYTAGNLSANNQTGGSVSAKSRTIKSRSLTGNVATITTTGIHGAIIGETVTISGIDSTFNGSYVITSIPSNNTFTYAKTEANVPSAVTTGAFVELESAASAEETLSTPGTAFVAGNLPSAATLGASPLATVSGGVTRRGAPGIVIKKNDVQFTPGLTSATAVRTPDILEINTKEKEVSYNGELEGARNRIDVLADFIELAPGDNQIEFEDSGNPESTATVRIYYRSGWLG
jgi:hypothetical protein